MSIWKKKLGGRKIRPYRKWKTFPEKNLVFLKRVGVIYSKSRQSKKGKHQSFTGNIFQKRIFFRSVKLYFPWLASCLLGRLLLTSLVSLRKRHSQEPCGEAGEGGVPSLSFPNARPAFPAASARNKQNWHMPSGQSSHRKVNSPNRKIKVFKQNLTFQTAFSTGKKRERGGGEEKKTNLYFLLEKKIWKINQSNSWPPLEKTCNT